MIHNNFDTEKTHLNYDLNLKNVPLLRFNTLQKNKHLTDEMNKSKTQK